MIYGYALHVHHEGPVIEPLTEPIEIRIEYIRVLKPPEQVELRLRLLRQLTDEEVAMLPARYAKAGARYCMASSEHAKARAEYDKAGDECGPELEALHKLLCLPDCPWDGQSIFLRPI